MNASLSPSNIEQAEIGVLVEKSADGIVVVDQNGVVLFANPASEEIFGRPSVSLVGSVLGIPLVGGETSEITIHKPGAAQIDAEIRLVGTRWRGRPAWLASIRDISARKAIHERLLASERQYRLLVEGLIDHAIFHLSREGLVSSWNAGAQRLQGYTADEIIGQHFGRFCTEEDRQAGMPEKALRIAQGEGKFEAEGWRVRRDGTRFWASVVIDALRDEAGELVGFIKITRDITERMETQRLRQAAEEQLAMAQRMEAVGELSGGIAHDFNNLLMIISGNLETAQRDALRLGDANLDRALKNAMRGAQRAASLTQRLLAFSRQQALDPKPLDLKAYLSDARDFLQRSLGETIEVETIGADDLWSVELDPNQLEIALLNLAINARDAMPDGGRLTLEAENTFLDREYCRTHPDVQPGHYVALSVCDTGSGMSKEVLNRAFEPFYTTKESGRGTGLGLSQVYGFIKQSGGHARIYSEIGQGTTVRMYLPRYVGSDARDEHKDDVYLPARHGEVILLVEDDDDLRGYLADALRSFGYTVLNASSAEGALDFVKQTDLKIDLMLTDLIMPGMSGRDLEKRATDLRPGLPVVYMTGYPRHALASQGRVDAEADVLQKPITQKGLAMGIRKALDRR